MSGWKEYEILLTNASGNSVKVRASVHDDPNGTYTYLYITERGKNDMVMVFPENIEELREFINSIPVSSEPATTG